MRTTARSERGLTLLETMVAITIFSIMTLGTVPLLGTALKGGATSRTSSVARNVAAKTLERLRGFQYHVPFASSGDKRVDLLDHFFPGVTPTFVPSLGTGYDAATQTYVTTCNPGSTADACSALPDKAEIPAGYLVEIRATFRSPANPATTAPVPADYAWNAAGGQDKPPSDLVEVRVAVTWSVGASARTYDLRSYLSARGPVGASASGGGGAPAPSPTPGGSVPPPNAVKLRSEARIDYGYEVTTTSQDNATPVRMREYTGTLGTAVAYGEQLDSGSKAELSVRAGRLQIVRPANPAVPGDTGMNIDVNGAALDTRAPTDATSTVVTTAPEGTATTTETPYEVLGWLAASEAGTLAGTRGAGPTVAGGLPFVKGYYDLNGTTAVHGVQSTMPTHFWLDSQTAMNDVGGAETSLNPIGLENISAYSMITVNEWSVSTSPAYQVDPRGEVTVDATATSPASTRKVVASSVIPSQGFVVLFPMWFWSTNTGALMIREFSANVNCEARADPATASSATGSWSAHLTYTTYWGDKRTYGAKTRQTTLPVQTLSGNPDVPVGATNPLQLIRNLNGGNGPKILDTDGELGDSPYDAYLFAGNGKRGLLTGWSQGSVQTSISADDRVASAQLNGAIRLETAPLYGPWPNPATGQVSQKPNSDVTFSMGKLSCRAEDYR